jgi:hypothetical protein
MNARGIPHAWWVDDVLLLGFSAGQVTQHALDFIKMCSRLGLRLNADKCMKEPAQILTYVGQVLNFGARRVEPVRYTGKCVTQCVFCSCSALVPSGVGNGAEHFEEKTHWETHLPVSSSRNFPMARLPHA